MQALYGMKPDISAIVIFCFWEKVYYKHIYAHFPNDSTEKIGRFVGVADSVGHTLTYKILSDEQRIIFRSRIRSAENTDVNNKIFEPLTEKSHLQSKLNINGMLPTIQPDWKNISKRTIFRWYKITCDNN